MSVMRSSLIGGLVDILASNINRKQARVRLFEVARVFKKSAEGFDQPEKVAGLAWGTRQPEQWSVKTERVDFFDAKGDVDAVLYPLKPAFRKAVHPAFHPGRCAEVLLNEQVIGVVGELHPKWVHDYDLPSAPVLFELNPLAVEQRGRVHVQPVSKFQPVRRDLALVVNETVEVGAMLSTFMGWLLCRHRLGDVALFDIYRGPGVAMKAKSLAASSCRMMPRR